LARDTELKGFFVVIGKRKRTFTIRGDLRKDGKRVSSIRVSIGDMREISTRTARVTAKEYLAQISRGQHPNPPQDETRGLGENTENKTSALADVSLSQAWQRSLDAHLKSEVGDRPKARQRQIDRPRRTSKQCISLSWEPRSPARSAISSAMVHPRLIGQASRIHVLREFLEYVEAKGGARITWRIDIARRWQERHASFPI
jgi:hypothetical protein